MCVLNRTSATNCAHIYNLSTPRKFVSPWTSQLEIDVDNDWDLFFLYALLQDCRHHDTILKILNGTTHSDHYLTAIQACNSAMVGPKNPYWNHACNLCCWVTENEAGEQCTS